VTIVHLKLACRHVREMMDVGVSENGAIRILELFADVYAKVHFGGSQTPHHVLEVHQRQWSVAARKEWERTPNQKAFGRLRVEHGTPRRAFARMVMELYDKDGLTEDAMATLVQKFWKLAVITIEEDNRLNQLARSKAAASPDERWRAAGILFAHDEPGGS
jgi:hypothetical protein